MIVFLALILLFVILFLAEVTRDDGSDGCTM